LLCQRINAAWVTATISSNAPGATDSGFGAVWFCFDFVCVRDRLWTRKQPTQVVRPDDFFQAEPQSVYFVPREWLH
jgi:hypothetical protein